MKIVNTIGGLGNQMFCYAFALALKKKHHEEVFIDISHFNYYNLHDGFLINDIFDVQEIKIATQKNISKLTRYIPHYALSRILRKLLPHKKSEYIEKKDYIFDADALNFSHDCYYEGYWQTPLYFDDIKNDVYKMFTFPEVNDANRDLSQLIRSVNSVSIHIRRGDYINAKSFVGICELDYYKKAISKINSTVKNPYFFIFSNDIEWCVHHLKEVLNTDQIKFINHNIGKESFWDMYLMSICKNMIIANSTFSWWAAYINQNANVISPKKWVNRDYETEIHLDSWDKI